MQAPLEAQVEMAMRVELALPMARTAVLLVMEVAK
jgi:hypothetical protein